jgi:hypothetical protein
VFVPTIFGVGAGACRKKNEDHTRCKDCVYRPVQRTVGSVGGRYCVGLGSRCRVCGDRRVRFEEFIVGAVIGVHVFEGLGVAINSAFLVGEEEFIVGAVIGVHVLEGLVVGIGLGGGINWAFLNWAFLNWAFLIGGDEH